MSASQHLRVRTSACHEAVDAAFGQADLMTSSSYADLLSAHARALIPAEAALMQWGRLPPWQARSEALASDLADLQRPLPRPLPFTLPDEPSAWGALYVLEGSRLGNIVLSRRAAPGLPTSYMNARHGQGDWRALLAAIDAAGERGGGDPWLDRAVAGAEATFALYLAAARAA